MNKIYISAAALIAAFAVGRYSCPTTTKTEKQTVVEKQQETDKDRHQETVVVQIQKPDGTKETTTTTVNDTKAVHKVDDITAISESKEVTRAAPTTVSALFGTSFSTSNPIDFGLSVTKPVLGPITVGIFAFKSGLIGGSIGITF